MPVVRTNDRSVGCTVTRLPNIYRMGRLPHFLRYGATLACVELGYRTKGQFLGEHHVVWTGKKVSSLAVVARTDCMMIGRGIEFSQGHAAKNQPMPVRNIITKQFIIIPVHRSICFLPTKKYEMLNTTIHSQFHTAAVNLGDTKPAPFYKKKKRPPGVCILPPPLPPPPTTTTTWSH